MTSIGTIHPWLIAVRTLHLAPPDDREPWQRADPHRQSRAPSANMTALVAVLPAGHPACFNAQHDWDDYILHAAVTGRRAHGDGPVIWIRGEPALNRRFSYCADCTAARQARMQAVGRCDTGFLTVKQGRQPAKRPRGEGDGEI